MLDNAQAAAILFPFLFTLIIASGALYVAVKATTKTAHAVAAPVRKIRNHRR